MRAKTQVRKVIFAGAIAALYTVLTIVFAPISYGTLQFRFAEVLTILPYYFPVAVPGLFLGCIVANILSPYGLADMIMGSTASLIAALITMRIGKSKNNEYLSNKALACIPPIVVNAIFIGALISFFMVGAGETDNFWFVFVANALQVGFGQSVVIYVIGLPLLIYLPKMGIIDKLKQLYTGNIMP